MMMELVCVEDGGLCWNSVERIFADDGLSLILVADDKLCLEDGS